MHITGDLSKSFLASVEKQQIFNTRVVADVKQSLVVRNGVDVFLSCGSLVRCCQITPESSNYVLMRTKSEFTIKSVVFNATGNMAALVGDRQINLVTLPQSIKGDVGYASNGSYDLNLMGGKQIKMVIWHPALASDAGLIVLTEDSRIQLFNVTISTEVPLLVVDLHSYSNFEGDATSITFGSSENLAGALSLYVTSSNGDIFVIYPFVYNTAKVSATHQQVTKLHNEATSLLKAVTAEFPSLDSIYEVANNVGLRARVINHYKYTSILKKLADKSSKAIPSSSDASPLIELNQRFPDSNTLKLQGPLTWTDSDDIPTEEKHPHVIELTNINDNDQITFLSALCKSDETGEYFIRYFIQNDALMMDWINPLDDEVANERPEPIVPKAAPKQQKQSENTPKGYVKPKKGFGFLVPSDEEDEASEDAEAAQIENTKIAEDLFEQEHLRTLQLAGHDRIGKYSSCTNLSKLNASNNKLCLVAGKEIIIIDTEEWGDEIVQTGISDVEKIKYEKLEAKHKNPQVALISDVVTDTGDYLVVYSPSIPDLEIHKAEGDISLEAEPHVISKHANSSLSLDNNSLSKKIPFEEIDRYIKIIFEFNTASFYDAVNQDLLKKKLNIEDPAVLKAVETLSRVALQQINILTKGLSAMHARLDLQTNDLFQQVEKVNKMNQSIPKNDSFEDNELRIRKCKERQERIDKRQEELKDKLINAIHKVRANRSFPLSKEERLWLKELNALNAKIHQDDEDDESVITKVTVLENQLDSIKSFIKDGEGKLNEDDDLTNKLEELRLGQSFSKLKQWLNQEEKSIELVKAKLRTNISKITA